MNTSSSPKVQYAYSHMPSGANHSRLTSITYPNGRVITYNYATGLASAISRLSSISDNGTTLEGYDYLGLGTVVWRTHPQAGVDLTYIKQSGEADGDAGDKYTGLDRFGRIVDQRWLITSNSTHIDRFKYGYDRNGNRLYEQNLVDAAFSELYHPNGAGNGYDKLNQLAAFRRGVLSDANSDGIPDTVSSPSRTQEWVFDPLGNWSTLTTNGTAQNRTHNRQNQITSITGLTTPSYDANGNMTGDENGKTLVYDAWNRLVDYKSGSTSLEAYSYDALGRRIKQGSTALYYSADWQVLEERDAGGIARVSMVWSPVYIDAMIARDRDADSNGSLEERLYVAHDANFNVSSIVGTNGRALERYILDPYGSPTFLDGSWSTLGGSAYAWTHLHQGGRQSSVSGLLHYRNRDRSAQFGVWTSLDPLGYPSKDVNLYRVLSGNTVGRVDPMGWAALDDVNVDWGCVQRCLRDAFSRMPKMPPPFFLIGSACMSACGECVTIPPPLNIPLCLACEFCGGIAYATYWECVQKCKTPIKPPKQPECQRLMNPRKPRGNEVRCGPACSLHGRITHPGLWQCTCQCSDGKRRSYWIEADSGPEAAKDCYRRGEWTPSP